MHKFTKLILDEYNRQGIKITDQNESAAYVSPLVELSDAQKDILSKGDGQKPNQYKQINSSTGLAVNYYKLLEEVGRNLRARFRIQTCYSFEKKQQECKPRRLL